jgi:TfoX/Sxy family transcriptional regulator of competence genes
MAYDEFLADRIRERLRKYKVEEKKMMGGLCFMVNDKMCVGIVKNELMARIHPDEHATAIQKKGCRTMDFTKKPMKGFVFINSEGYDEDKDLDGWINLALAFNEFAKPAKKKK